MQSQKNEVRKYKRLVDKLEMLQSDAKYSVSAGTSVHKYLQKMSEDIKKKKVEFARLVMESTIKVLSGCDVEENITPARMDKLYNFLTSWSNKQ